MGLIDKSLGKKRLDVCIKCEKFEKAKWGVECTMCGCKLKIKTRIVASKCPLDKW